jgi:hypothetical protein
MACGLKLESTPPGHYHLVAVRTLMWARRIHVECTQREAVLARMGHIEL